VKPAEQRHLPRQVDTVKLTQQGVILEGTLAVRDLPRLVATLHDDSLILHPVLQFGVDEEGHRTVTGSFQARLPLTCQRCLETMDYDIESEFHCAFVSTDAQAKALPANLEPVMLANDSSHVNLYDMLEDEVLLSLPIAAFHDQCDAGNSAGMPGESKGDAVSANRKPFAALANLFNKKD
jgi:uncharacterized protein